MTAFEYSPRYASIGTAQVRPHGQDMRRNSCRPIELPGRLVASCH